jgi:hypothetical protein
LDARSFQVYEGVLGSMGPETVEVVIADGRVVIDLEVLASKGSIVVSTTFHVLDSQDG